MVSRSCKLCSSLGGGGEKKFSTLDDQKSHAQLHVSQLAYILEESDRMSVEQIFDKCFPSDNFENQTIGIGEENEESRTRLIAYCKNIIEAKKNKSGSIKCQVCQKNVRYMGKTSQDAYLILNHAGTHSTTKPYGCRYCQFESANLTYTKRHGKKKHQISSPKLGVHFDEFWADHFEDIKKSLTRSFIGSNSNKDLSPQIPSPPSKLSIQRRLIFSQIKASAVKDDKIRCRLCDKKICGTVSRHLEQHIYFAHLKRRIYECAMCGYSVICLRLLKKHITNDHHRASWDDNYTDRLDKYHEEILEWAEKCFGEKMIK